MTLNTTYRITPIDTGLTRVYWTAANATDVSWIYIDGRVICDSLTPTTAARNTVLPFQYNEAVALEIHDIVTGGPDVVAINDEPNIYPTLSWNRDDNADFYKVYHQAYGESESTLATINAESTISLYTYVCVAPLVNGWHFFRVESIDTAGNESTQVALSYHAMDIPVSASTLTVEDGSSSGLFNFAST